MIRFGVLTVQNEKTSFFQKIRKPIVMVETFTTQAEVLVASFSWTIEELMLFPLWVRRFLYRKGVKILSKRGCVKVNADSSCKDIFRYEEGEEAFISPVSTAMMPKAAEFCLKRYGTQPFSAAIKAAQLSKVQDELLSFLCPQIASLTILTEDLSYAELLSEKICIEYGFYPQIKSNLSCLPVDHLLLDMDEGMLCLNDTVVDGVEVKMDFHQYRVNQAYFLKDSSILPEKLEFVSWTKGKKRLTSH